MTARGEYRPDVDGLRAVAVLAVVAFHAFPRLLPGGFVGVDVFFVISGYLISGILFDEAQRRGTVDLAAFYVRRIRRIFPALTVVLIAVGLGTRLILTSTDYAEVLRHIGAGAVFVSNFVLWREAGYFDAPARLKPLLHLWSLGIEEQFYLCWPPVVYFCARHSRRAVTIAAALALASFTLNVAFARSAESAVFYLPVTRIWELLLGALIAYPRGVTQARVLPAGLANLAGVAGLALLAASMMLLSGRVVFPGWWALVPTLGTALVIVAGSGSWVNRRLLSLAPVVFVGLISYPLYLWHWPLLFVLQITEGGAPSVRLKLGAVAVSFVLATLTFLLVERPIRRRLSIRTPRAIAALAAILLAAGAVSFYSQWSGRFMPRAPYLIAGIYSAVPSPRTDAACRARFPTHGEYCQQYDAARPVTTALLGNSHAEHFLEGVGASLSAKGENVVHLGQSGCAPLVDLQRFVNDTNDTCVTPDNAVIDLVARSPQITRVILSFNGTVMANGTGAGGGYEVMELAGTLLPPDESIRVALERTARRFLDAGKSVWVILEVPEMEFQIQECFARPFSFEHRVRTPCATPLAHVVARETKYRQIVKEAQMNVPALQVVDPRPVLCDTEWCYAMRDRKLLYVDDNHLSREGSLLFRDRFRF